MPNSPARKPKRPLASFSVPVIFCRNLSDIPNFPRLVALIYAVMRNKHHPSRTLGAVTNVARLYMMSRQPKRLCRRFFRSTDASASMPSVRVMQKRSRQASALPFVFPFPSSRHLDGTGRNHLLAEVVLVLPDAAFPPLNGLVVAHEDFLGDLVKESIETVSYPCASYGSASGLGSRRTGSRD